MELTISVFTVGHSNHTPQRFLELLKQHEIGLIIDVRSSPYSAYASHFNKDVIDRYLQAEGIGYVFLGDVIGGRPEGEAFYDGEGYVLYDRVAQSPGFQHGVDRLLNEVRTCRVALVCGEEDPTDCHRRRLIGRVLQQRDVAVFHIRGDGRLQSEAETAREEAFRKTKGQMTLFDVEDSSAWKSTQSASPKNRPANSSGFSETPESGG